MTDKFKGMEKKARNKVQIVQSIGQHKQERYQIVSIKSKDKINQKTKVLQEYKSNVYIPYTKSGQK